jgi:phosphopantetheine adenylyltransferase
MQMLSINKNCSPVNGTFDHLHHGHRNHLGLAAWLATETLICSISPDDQHLHSRKKSSSQLQSYAVRVAAVQDFLFSIKPKSSMSLLQIRCVPSNSSRGAQGNDATVCATVLSTESCHLSAEINQIRVSNGLSSIAVFTVDVVRPYDSLEKLSSSAIRKLISERQVDIILLNGSAGVGKHTISMHLSGMIPGSRVIDNHLMSDLADALCDRSNPGYVGLRKEMRRLAFDFILTNQDIARGTNRATFIFTANFSISEAGTNAARDFEEFATRCDARFIPIVISCSEQEIERRVAHPDRNKHSRTKLTDPQRAVFLLNHKTMFRFLIPAELSLDVTNLTGEKAAAAILEHRNQLAI